jgi:hypothetical protein
VLIVLSADPSKGADAVATMEGILQEAVRKVGYVPYFRAYLPAFTLVRIDQSSANIICRGIRDRLLQPPLIRVSLGQEALGKDRVRVLEATRGLVNVRKRFPKVFLECMDELARYAVRLSKALDYP